MSAIASSKSSAAGARSRASASAARQAYDPVGVNGVAQSTLLRLSQSVSGAMSSKVLAGVALDTHAGMLDVYLANASQATRDSAMAAVPAADRSLVRIHHVPLSQAGLNAAMRATGAVADRLLSARAPVQSYYPDFMSGKVVVTLYNPTAAQRSRVAAAMKSLPVRVRTTSTAVQPVPPVTAPVTASAPSLAGPGRNRAFGSSPWAGGSFIDSTYGGFFHLCTDSWPISIGTKRYITTAGHCAPAGHKWINLTLKGTSPSNVKPLGDRKFIGRGTENELKTRKHLDVQLLPTANVPEVWSGHLLKNYLTRVKTHLVPPVGTMVCNDGAYEGTTCGAKVTRSNHNVCVVVRKLATLCHLYEAKRPKGKVLIGEGDSGGPDYVKIGTAGHVTAAKGVGLNSLETVANLRCPFFTWRGRVCSNVMFFTGLNSILKNYGAKLRTKK